VPAIMLSGITIVISPLISLMKDQVNTLVHQGVSAAYLNRSLTEAQYSKALQNASLGKYKIIYVAPERLNTASFLNMCSKIKISMIAVDEAHCVSQWGQDFRPSYLNINNFIQSLPERPIIGAFTATATDKVKNDMIKILHLNNPEIVTTGFDRPNLFFSVLRPNKKPVKLLELVKERRGKSGIIYCSTRKTVEKICDLLNDNGFNATRYHAGLNDKERVQNQEDFVYDRKPVMVATNAFGMGIDKSNVSYVIHYNMPKNLESYYQEAGRAGRDGEEADCILLYGEKDVQTCRYFIDNIEPNPQLTDKENKLFIKQEEERLKQMIFYCRTSDCLRGYMLKYFGDNGEDNCGKCSNCVTKFKTEDVTIKAQKILSCIIKTGQNYGAKMIIDVLRGKTNNRILSFGFNKQSTFGIMKDVKPTEIKYIIENLEQQGCIESVGINKPVLKVTELSFPILRGNAKIKVKKSKKIKTHTENVYSGEIDLKLLDELKAVRKYFAQMRGVPDYVIFSDATLVDMCRIKPVTEKQFLMVSGVTEIKLEKYGNKFIKVISEFENSILDNSKDGKKYNVAQIRENGLKSAYEPWTEKELAKLNFEFELGMSIEKIAKNHGRTKGAIKSQLRKMRKLQ
jgi:ATP-dependent DNA helicase RecQ